MDFSFLDDWTDEEEQVAVPETGGDGYRNVWVMAEMAGSSLAPATLEAMGQARDLADQIGVYVWAVLLGTSPDDTTTQQLIALGADKVLTAPYTELDEYQTETYTQALAALVEAYRPEILLLGGTALGGDLAPRLAQRLGTGLLSHCLSLDLDMAERLLLGTFADLGGQVYQTAACPEARPQIATLKPGYFRHPYEDNSRSGDIQAAELDLAGASGRLAWIDLDAEFSLPPVPLSKANIVVAGGRGMVDAEGFQLVHQLAEALGGSVGGSRGAFDEGWITEEQIVGVGGTQIAPALYIGCGISGDLYHSFGIQDAGFVVAINMDPDAPLIKTANMAAVGDARGIVREMIRALAG